VGLGDEETVSGTVCDGGLLVQSSCNTPLHVNWVELTSGPSPRRDRLMDGDTYNGPFILTDTTIIHNNWYATQF